MSNIGRIIKITAIVLFGVNMLATFVGGIVIASLLDKFWIFLVAQLGGAIVFYILFIIFFGYGELVENSKLTVNRISRLSSAKPAPPKGTYQMPTSSDPNQTPYRGNY